MLTVTHVRLSALAPRVPTRFVQKYTVTAQLEPSGTTEPIVAASPHVDLVAVGLRGKLASRINRGGETVGCRGDRFCQEQTHVLAEQFNSMEHDDRPSTAQPREAPAARRADERPPVRGPPGRQRTLAARSVAGSDRRRPRRPRQGRRRLRGAQRRTSRSRASNIQTKVVTTLFALFAEVERDLDSGAFPISRSRAHTHRRHGHPLQTVPSAGLIERPQEKNRVDALR